MRAFDRLTCAFWALACVVALTSWPHGGLAANRYWTGAGANALASNSTNWLDNIAPVANDAVFLDDRTNKNMTWDLDIPLQSWTQAGYLGTVTVATVYGPAGLTNLSILGDCVISNGVWTHANNSNLEVYRLCASIGGNLYLGPDGRIDVMARGFVEGYGPGKGIATHGAASHGGVGIYRTDTGAPGFAPCYGNLFTPTNCGSGGVSWGLPGGGAIRLAIGGTAYVDGWVMAESESKASGNNRMGSGGSIWMSAGAISGTGVVSVCGGSGDVGGGGGRMAIYLTGEGSDFSGWQGSLRAYGGTSRSSGGMPASAGTIYRETKGQPAGGGDLLVDNGGRASPFHLGVLTFLSLSQGPALSFSSLTLTNGGFLAISTNETLDIRAAGGTPLVCAAIPDSLPAGLRLYKGGALLMDETMVLSNFTLCINDAGVDFSPSSLVVTGQGRWVVSAPLVMTSQVTLAAGGVLSHSANGTTDPFKLDLSVIGNMTIATNAKIDVKGKGYSAGAGPGGGNKASHGGRGGYSSRACYGSLTKPTSLGSSAGGTYLGGGAVRLRVTGLMHVDGAIDADGVGAGSDSGAGGSIWVEAGTLAGGGSIIARAGGYNVVGWGSGGGRVALAVTNNGADFNSFSGIISASGSGPYGGAGTVYMRTAAQGEGEGLLLIANTDPKGNGLGRTEITTQVTDLAVGTVMLRGKTELYFSETPWGHSGTTWTPPAGVVRVPAEDFFLWPVSRGWSNAGTFHALTNTAVQFDPIAPASASIIGTSTFYGVVCTNPGSTLYFATNSLTKIADNGLFCLRGSDSDKLRLRSSADGAMWPLTLLAAVEQDVLAVDVQDSDASVGGGATVFAYESVGESANNVNWKFLSTNIPPITNFWTGGSDSGWLNSDNWSAGIVPQPRDWVVISNNCAFYPALAADLAVRDLTIRSGARVELRGFSLTVNEGLRVGGLLQAMASENITVKGGVDFAGGTNEAAQSLFVLAGESDQTVEMSGNTFYRIVATNAGRTLTFNGGFTADRLTCENPAAELLTLAFEPGEIVRLDQLRVRGHATEKSVRLQAASAGSWLLAVQHYADVQYVSAGGCDAAEGEPVYAFDSADLGGNTNWVFDSDVAYWVGPAAGDFHNPANWSGSVVPDSNTLVILSAPATVTVSQAAAVGRLEIGGEDNKSEMTAFAPLTVSSSLVVRANGTLALNEPSQVGGDLWLLDNGVLTHSPNATTAETNKLELTVLGNGVVEPGASVDVRGKGYQRSKSFGTHGGLGTYEATASVACYGSVTAPTNCGMRGGQSNGGGVINLVFSGDLTHFGMITASGAPYTTYNGAGGSVWIRARTLSGAGTIEAKGAASTAWSAAGGRVSLVLSGGDFNSFTGTVSADTDARAVSGGRSSAGTIYREAAGQLPGRGIVTIWQEQPANTGFDRGTQLPSTNGITNELKQATVRVEGYAIMVLNGDLAVRDLEMPDSTGALWLKGHTLWVGSREHALTGTVTEAGGQIIWKGPDRGTMFTTW